jgi:REP element-mobilizing transposase RayT
LIFRDDLDRLRYLVLVGRVVARFRWRCLAYCLMGNHLHLVVETPIANLGAGMQVLHGDHARSFNARHKTSGHVFQGRYGSKRVKTDAQLWQVLEYLALNPVEAGLCSRPEEWRWGSRGAVTRGAAPGWLDDARTAAFLRGMGAAPGTGALAA